MATTETKEHKPVTHPHTQPKPQASVSAPVTREATIKEPVTQSPPPFVSPSGMHPAFVDSMGIENLFKYYEFDTSADCDKAAGETGASNRLANLYMRQKGVLVDGRDDLQAALETLTGFKQLMTTETVKKEDGTEEKKSVPAEKPGEWWSRFKKAVLTGELKHAKLNGTSQELFEESVRVIAHGLGPYLCDPKKAVREAKEKKLADLWLNAAKQIIANGTQAKWEANFRNGTKEVPTPTPFEPFTTPTPAGASPEEAARVLETNATNLGWAIKAYDAKISKSRYV